MQLNQDRAVNDIFHKTQNLKSTSGFESSLREAEALVRRVEPVDERHSSCHSSMRVILLIPWLDGGDVRLVERLPTFILWFKDPQCWLTSVFEHLSSFPYRPVSLFIAPT